MSLSASTKLLFLDGFDIYENISSVSRGLLSRWDDASSTFSLELASAQGGQALVITSGSSRNLDKSIPANQQIACGGSVRWSTLSVSGNQRFFIFETSPGNRQFSVNINSNGQLRVYSDGNELGSSSTDLITTDTEYFIELEGFIDSTSGWVKVWVDNTLVIDVSNVDTQEQGVTTASNFRFHGGGSSASGITRLDDLYIATERIGRGKIFTFTPTSDASPNDWTPDSGTDNFSQVNQVPYDGVGGTDSSYIRTSSDNVEDFYAIGFSHNILDEGLSTFHLAQINVHARKTTTSSASQLRLKARQNTDSVDGATEDIEGIDTEDHYATYSLGVEGFTSLTGLEIGVESIDADPELRVSGVNVEIFADWTFANVWVGQNKGYAVLVAGYSTSQVKGYAVLKIPEVSITQVKGYAVLFEENFFKVEDNQLLVADDDLEVGVYRVTLKATDDNSQTLEQDKYVFVVADDSLHFFKLEMPDLVVGDSVDEQIVQAVGGTEPYEYEVVSGSLPTGTSLELTTGSLVGTPSESGDFENITIRATDQDGSTADVTVSLSVTSS